VNDEIKKIYIKRYSKNSKWIGLICKTYYQQIIILINNILWKKNSDAPPQISVVNLMVHRFILEKKPPICFY
jgi:hypothetical protein